MNYRGAALVRDIAFTINQHSKAESFKVFHESKRDRNMRRRLAIKLIFCIIILCFYALWMSRKLIQPTIESVYGRYYPATAKSSSLSEDEALKLKPGDMFYMDPKTSKNFAVFYNIFIPKRVASAQDLRFKRSIVEEQLIQVGKSYVGSPSGPNQKATVFYNTIGKPDGVNTTYIDQLCGEHNLICKHMAHYDTAFEEVTLQQLYNFCRVHENYRVAYIHSKGTYHYVNYNTYLRRHGTMAATSEMCLKPVNESCNLCGLQFYPYWAFFMPGNFWTAHCSYINRLLPPMQFEERMNETTKKALRMKRQNKFKVNMFDGRSDHYGTERFAAEHWVGSHPSIIPCDVGGKNAYGHWMFEDQSSEDFEFAMGPRKNGSPLGEEHVGGRGNKLLEDEENRTKEYFLLAGRLFKWYELYNQAPPNDSWIWDAFPDGDRWRQAVAEFGSKTVELVTSGRASLPKVPSDQGGSKGLKKYEFRPEKPSRKKKRTRKKYTSLGRS